MIDTGAMAGMIKVETNQFSWCEQLGISKGLEIARGSPLQGGSNADKASVFTRRYCSQDAS